MQSFTKLRFILFPLLVISFLILPLSCSRRKEESKNRLEQLSLADRKILEVFFEVLFTHDAAGFTLFGNKPITFLCYILPEEGSSINERNVFGALMEEGWKVFEKYPEIFRSKNFSLKRSIHPMDPLPVVYITLVNKKVALETIQTNILLFQEQYGLEFDAESYLASLEYVAYEPSVLTSILLGYGEKSGWTFHRRCLISQFYYDHPTIFEGDRNKLSTESLDEILYYGPPRIPGPLINDLNPTSGFTSLAEEFYYIIEHYSAFSLEGTEHFCTFFGLPAFACLDNDEGIKQIEKSYQTTLETLSSRYKDRPVLEVTLEQWQKEQ